MREIRVRGARQHNLKGIDLDIPKDALVAITGPSGCGKSSLAFHTIYAEGQRRYVESLSVYARQFLDQLDKPDVDVLEGLSPAIAIEQRGGGLNPRSTVATGTEIYDFLRVLWAALGVPHDPVTGQRLERMDAPAMVAALAGLAEGTKVILLAPVPTEELDEPLRMLGDLQRQGYIRVRLDGEVMEIEDAARQWPEQVMSLEIVIDRLVIREGIAARLADSVEAALRICGAEARAAVQQPGADSWSELVFQTAYRMPSSGAIIEALTPKHFSFNSPVGACESCGGLGVEKFVDERDLTGPADRPMRDGGIVRWWNADSPREAAFSAQIAAFTRAAGVSEDARLDQLSEKFRKVLWHGGGTVAGLPPDFEGLANEALRRHQETSSESVRRKLGKFLSERRCQDCGGQRLKPEWLAVRVEAADGWRGIQDFCAMDIGAAERWIAGLVVEAGVREVATRLAEGIVRRLGFLREVGLDYLTLDRVSNTLSGGEAQRIRLATQLGAGLSGVIYVLDEPSIGLHPVDSRRLIGALQRLRGIGNSILVVEHDAEIIRAADWVIDLGPGAGAEGGEVLAAGPPDSLASPTGEWLAGTAKRFQMPPPRTPAAGELVVRGASEHNLRNLTVAFPLGRIVCVCGASGSGKSTLVDDILRVSLARHFHQSTAQPGKHTAIEGLEGIGKFIVADQSAIGRGPRSNPATFSGAYDLIRELFGKLPLSKQRGYGSGRFSFNLGGGRCDRCQGNGRLKIEMHFLPDAWVVCPACEGRRFNRETLEVTFKGKSIAEVLELRVDEAAALFRAVPKLHRIFAVLIELGLGYLVLGQPANTLSGGESQRLKLALELAKPAAPHTLYLLDEPTTGLHFMDVDRLLAAIARLRDAGHSVIVVEHHPDVISAADHIIELGPGGGREGGALIASGTVAEVMANPDSRIAPYLTLHERA